MARLTARPGGGMFLKTGGGKFLKNSAATGGMIQKNDMRATAGSLANEVGQTSKLASTQLTQVVVKAVYMWVGSV